MSVQLQLRAWQGRFARALAKHRRDDFLLVACPAAGKTIAAGAAIAQVMAARDCDQLVVVCPTVVVRDQWAAVLGELGYRMLTDFRGAWPEHVHGVCATYQQVSQRRAQYAAACEQRGTVAIFDEIHHAGEQKSWGDALAEAFPAARMRLMLSGTPFRSDRDRIPFLTYASDGTCVPDFTYDYPHAVRDGVCRPIEFKAHDGRITWTGHEDGEPFTAGFRAPVTEPDRARRLRACLDPTHPYLAAMLADAHDDLQQLRQRIPDAAGLIVCDSQAHALEVDDLLAEIIGSMSALAISDMPRAHQAIRQFASDDTEWLVSVRMVAEGVDIPRLGVIVWCTASKTELMVRQVAGRALRGRNGHELLPAIVHMPADPTLTKYASRLDVLGGVSLRHRDRESDNKPRVPPRLVRGVAKEISAAPLAEWIERNYARLGGNEAIAQMLSMSPDSWARLYYRWREPNAEKGERGYSHVVTLWDFCGLLGADFDTLFAADEFAAAREFLETSGLAESRNRGIDAQPASEPPKLVAPPLPQPRLLAAPEPLAVDAPALPPSPDDIAAAERARQGARADVFRLLSVYTQLRRAASPGFQLTAAHGELAAAVGAITATSTPERLADACQWLRARAGELAAQHPEQARELARAQRRHRTAGSR